MEDLTPTIIGLGVALSFLAIATYVARVVTRFSSGMNLAIDDYCIGIALVLSVASAIVLIVDTQFANLGRRESRTPLNLAQFFYHVTFLTKSNWAIDTLILLCVGITKIGVLLFYKRIFVVDQRFSRAVTILIFLCGINIIAFGPPILLFCVTKAEYLGRPKRAMVVLATSSAIDVFLNLIVLALPLSKVWHLQMPIGRKLAVTSVFLLGIFVSASGIARLMYVVQRFATFTTPEIIDATYIFAPIYYWSQTESSLGVICANLITLGPLFKCRLCAKVASVFQFLPILKRPESTRSKSEGKARLGSDRGSTENGSDISRPSMFRWSNTNLGYPKDLYSVNVEGGTMSRQSYLGERITVQQTVTLTEVFSETE